MKTGQTRPPGPMSSEHWGLCPQTPGIFKAWQDKRMRLWGQKAKRPETQPPRAIAGHSPALIWLSLAGLRPRRAQRRFTRRRP